MVEPEKNESDLQFVIAPVGPDQQRFGIKKGAGGGRQVKRTCTFGQPDQDRKQV
jgi:hypothetical protein